jgi:hypothetical protein
VDASAAARRYFDSFLESAIASLSSASFGFCRQQQQQQHYGRTTGADNNGLHHLDWFGTTRVALESARCGESLSAVGQQHACFFHVVGTTAVVELSFDHVYGTDFHWYSSTGIYGTDGYRIDGSLGTVDGM